MSDNNIIIHHVCWVQPQKDNGLYKQVYLRRPYAGHRTDSLRDTVYFGVSILRDIFHNNKNNTDSAKSGRKWRVSENQTTMCSVKKEVDARHCLSRASSQTDLTLPIGVRHRSSAFRNVPPELWTPWAKTIEERIRELNIRLVNTTNFQYRNYGKHFKPKNCYNLGNTSGDQLSAQNSLKINIKFLTAYWTLIFIPWQLYFSCDYSLTIPYFSFFPLDKMVNSLTVKAKPQNCKTVGQLSNIFKRYSPALLSPEPYSPFGHHTTLIDSDDRRYRSVEHLDLSCGNEVSDRVPKQSTVKPKRYWYQTCGRSEYSFGNRDSNT